MKSSVLQLSYTVAALKGTYSLMEEGRSDAPPLDGTSAFTRYMNYGPSSKATLMALVPTPRHIRVQEIRKEVASAHGFRVERLITPGCRSTPIVRARQEAVARLLLETDLSTAQIGKALGYKDHSTVMYVGNLLYGRHIKFKSGIWVHTPVPQAKLDKIPRKGRRNGQTYSEDRGRAREIERREAPPPEPSVVRVGNPSGRAKGFCEAARERGKEEARALALCTQTSVSRSAGGPGKK